MVFDQIESLKQQYTDKYVIVDETRPELSRFRGLAGQIKTVNMSGRALVEFEAYNNIGWYDIELDFLKVVDKPLPKPAEDKHAKPAAKAAAKPAAEPAKPKAEAPAGEKKPSALEMARAQGAAKKPGEAPKKSTSDILAAARGGKAAAPMAKEAPAPKEVAAPKEPAAPKAAAAPAPAAGGEKKRPSTAEIIAAARAKKGLEPAAPIAAAPASPAPAPPPAPAAATPPAAGKKPSTAEILAAARRKAAPTEAAAPPAPVAPEPAAEAPAPVVEETAAEPAPPVAAEKPAAKAAPAGDLPKTTAEKIAWCRQHDAK
ncbi:MAG TPA: hypothetical protein VHC22_28175 [Pirellulales bacterium]|nr:hypothetical protein [Pirellulales bacterium]